MRTTVNQYAKTLLEVTSGKSQKETDDAILNFVKILIKDRRTKLSGKISEKFAQLWNECEKIIEAEVISREKLSQQAIEKIREKIAEKYAGCKIVLKEKVDKGMKGGVIVKIANDVLDASVDNRLKNLKMFLSK